MSYVDVRQLRRLRWAVRAVLTLGVAASLAANVLHARPNLISQTIAGWPPVALLFTVELISRIPMQRRALAWVRVLATAVIAGIAAWVSYWHMAGVAARYGESGSAPYLLPFSVDGLIVVASVCLVELSDRLRAVDVAAAVPVPAAALVDVVQVPTGDPVPAPVPIRVPAAEGVDIEPDSEQDTAPAKRRPPRRVNNAERVARLAARRPGASPAELAARLGVSVKTVKRHLPAATTGTTVDSDPDMTMDTAADSGPVNGATIALDTAPV